MISVGPIVATETISHMLPKSPLFRIPATIWLALVGIVLLFVLASMLLSAFNFAGFILWLGIALFAGAYGGKALWAFSRLQAVYTYGGFNGFKFKKD